MKHLDLFSGIGGFALAARWTNKIETIQFVEIDKFCQKVLRKNFPNVPIHDDIKTFHYHEHVDLITGGFPCQPFSVAGKKKGKKDDRYLWPEFSRIIRESKPNWIIAENVSGMLAMELDNIIDDLETQNYASQTFIIPASAAEAPHRRDRLWIVANINSKRCENRKYNWQKRYLQTNEKWNVEALQSNWEQCKPITWKTFNAQEFITNNDSLASEQIDSTSKPKCVEGETWCEHPRSIGIESKINWQENKPPVCGVDDGLSHLVDRNKSLGNAIVPQVVYPILALIAIIDSECPHNNN